MTTTSPLPPPAASVAPPGARRTIAGAASTAVADALTGRPQTARLLHASRHAAYLETAGSTVVAVVTRDGAAVACAVCLAEPAAGVPELGSLRAGGTATVGGGRIELPWLSVPVGRWWSPAVAVGPISDERLSGALAALRRALRAARPGLPPATFGPLRRALADGDAAAAMRAADALLGLGPGTTPSGDDVLAGALTTLTVLARAERGDAVRYQDVVVPLARHVTAVAGHRTTPVSAALLRHAARGEASGELAAVLRSLPTGRIHGDPLARLLRVGRHSGSDLAAGIEVALTGALSGGSAPATSYEERW